MSATFGQVPLVGPSSLVQGRRPSNGRFQRLPAPRQLEAVVLTPGEEGFELHHYLRAQDRPDRGWRRLGTVSPLALGPGAIAAAGETVHVLVPEPVGIVHYVQRGASWARRGTLGRGRTVALATRGTGLVALVGSEDGSTVWSFDGRWQVSATLPGHGGALATGPRGRLAAVGVAGAEPRCWFRQKGRWAEGPPVAATGTALPALAWTGATWLAGVPCGDVVATFELGEEDWRASGALTWGAGTVTGLALAGSGLHGWVQALTDEDGSLFHHHRQSGGAQPARWMRSACFRLADPEPFLIDREESVKLAQISGEVDSQPSPDGEPRPTLSRSESSAGVRGTDLGVRTDHGGRTFLLFGDTHWRYPWRNTRDAIAEVVGDSSLPRVRFHGSPLKVRGGRVTQREYDVPTDGFSLHGQFYGFFTSNHFAREQTMGRSVLARAVDPALPVEPAARWRPLGFRYLTTFSTRHFINVSVQPFRAGAIPGFAGQGDVLLLWGSGAYRAGDLRLAVLDPRTPTAGAALAGGRGVPLRALGVRYWAGTAGGTPVWADTEEDARPLLHPGAFGELSVRWVPQVGRFLLLSGAGPEDSIGPAITLRTASDPWGPWSPRRRLLDWIVTGMAHHDQFSRFIKAVADGSDPVGDRIFRGQADATGAAYAPYFFDAVVEGDHLRLRYTLSTWNPYQVVLMEHRLPLGEL